MSRCFKNETCADNPSDIVGNRSGNVSRVKLEKIWYQSMVRKLQG